MAIVTAEIAAEEYASTYAPEGFIDPVRYYAFLAGAKWQKEQDAKEIAALKEEIENYKYEMKEMRAFR